MKFRIVADSSSDILSLEGADYQSVPLKILVGEQEFVDNAQLDVPAMLAAMAANKGRSGTACPSVGEWIEAFGDAEAVFALTITSNLSGCYNASVQAKEIYEQEHPERKVCCLDSLSTGPEMALIIEKLLELMENDISFEEAEEQIRDYMKNNSHLLFMLESVDNLAKNGRVSPLIAKAVGVLGIRIVGKASDEGTLQQLHKARGSKKGLAALYNEMVEMGYKGGKVRIRNCQNPSVAAELQNMIKAHHPSADIGMGVSTGLCSFYAETGSIMVGFES